MRVGQYVDGRPLNYEQSTCQYDIGGTHVTVDQVMAYDHAGQISWASSDVEAWARHSFAACGGSAAAARTPTAERKNAWVQDWLREFFARRSFLEWLGVVFGGGLILTGVFTLCALAARLGAVLIFFGAGLYGYATAAILGPLAVGLSMIAAGILLSASVEVSLRKQPAQAWREWVLLTLRATRSPLWDALQLYVLLAAVCAAVAIAGAVLVILLGVAAVVGVLYLWSQSSSSGAGGWTQTTQSRVRTTRRATIRRPTNSRPQVAIPGAARLHYDATGNYTGQTLDGKHYDATGSYTGQTLDGKHYDATGSYHGQSIDG